MYESPWTQASNYPTSSFSSYWAVCYCFLFTILSPSFWSFSGWGYFCWFCYSSYSSDSDTILVAFLAGTLAFGLTYYSLYYSLSDYCFFFETTGFCAGDLAFWSGDLVAFLVGLRLILNSHFLLIHSFWLPSFHWWLA